MSIYYSKSSVREVDLSSNCVGDHGAFALARTFLCDEKFRSVDVSYNLIGPRGGRALLKALKQRCKYHSVIIELGNNIMSLRISDEIALLNSKATRSLTSVNVSQKEMKRIEEDLQFEHHGVYIEEMYGHEPATSVSAMKHKSRTHAKDNNDKEDLIDAFYPHTQMSLTSTTVGKIAIKSPTRKSTVKDTSTLNKKYI